MQLKKGCSNTVFVLVHGDMWGALLAQRLLAAVDKQYCNIVFIVTRTSPDTGPPTPENFAYLRAVRAMKEDGLHDFFKAIDAARGLEKLNKIDGSASVEPEYLTFQGLAEKYTIDQTVHYTTDHWKKGGKQVEEIFKSFEAQGIIPNLVLSGDTLALLPEWITETYPCYGTHPGPMPEVRGRYSPYRSVIHELFYDDEGMPWTGHSLSNIQGTIFKLGAQLDDHANMVQTVQSPYVSGMTLDHAQAALYLCMVEYMCSIVGDLLNPESRNQLMETARARNEASQKTDPRIIPNLNQDDYLRWVCAYDGNQMFDPNQFRNWFRGFWPFPCKGADEAYNEVFDSVFSKYLKDEEKHRIQVTDRRTYGPDEMAAMMNPDQPRLILPDRALILPPFVYRGRSC